MPQRSYSRCELWSPNTRKGRKEERGLSRDGTQKDEEGKMGITADVHTAASGKDAFHMEEGIKTAEYAKGPEGKPRAKTGQNSKRWGQKDKTNEPQTPSRSGQHRGTERELNFNAKSAKSAKISKPSGPHLNV